MKAKPYQCLLPTPPFTLQCLITCIYINPTITTDIGYDYHRGVQGGFPVYLNQTGAGGIYGVSRQDEITFQHSAS